MLVYGLLFGGGFSDPFDEGRGFFSGAPAIFVIFFVLIASVIIGAILYSIVKGVGTWSRNNAAEERQLGARLIAKRVKVRGGAGDSSSSTDYFLTFEFDTGERLEFEVRGKEYGLLAEGDAGTLTFQGTRYKGFARFT